VLINYTSPMDCSHWDMKATVLRERVGKYCNRWGKPGLNHCAVFLNVSLRIFRVPSTQAHDQAQARELDLCDGPVL
jgi:hypothetical protein